MKRKLRPQFVIFTLCFIVLIIGILYFFSFSTITYHFTNYDEKEAYTIQYGDENYQLPEVTITYQLPSGRKYKLNSNINEHINIYKLDTYTVKYSPTFPFFYSSKKITVEVIDTTAPTITLTNDEDYWIWPEETYQEEGFSAIDNYDGDITSNVKVSEIVDGCITYSVTDSNGNYAEVQRKIKYKDTDAPVLTIDVDYLAFKVGGQYELPHYQAIDENEGDLTSKVIVTDNIKPNNVGCYEIKYSVSDRWGNTSEKSINVYVYRNNVTTVATQKVNKSIYLTFDDGPGQYTAKLLDILDKYNVKATFFVTNTNSKYQDMIGEAYRRGHSIGVHAYQHTYSLIYTSEQAFWEDNTKMSEIVYEQTGTYTNIMRFPGGTSNTVSKNYKKGIMTALSKSAAIMGYRYFDWNVDSNDAGGATSSDEVFNNVVNQCSKKNVCVVLQHDIKGFSVDAVERIIQWGLANGYTFLPITDTTPVSHHPSFN